MLTYDSLPKDETHTEDIVLTMSSVFRCKIQGNGYKTRQRPSNEQTKNSKFMLEGPRLGTESFDLHSYTLLELRNQHLSIG